MKVKLIIKEIKSENENVIAHQVQKIVNDFMVFIKEMYEIKEEEEEE